MRNRLPLKPITRDEKRLAAILMILVAAIFGFYFWHRAITPRLLPTPQPVISARFVNQKEILVIMRPPHTLSFNAPSTVACYDVESGRQLWFRTDDVGADLTDARASPDGRWLLLSHYSRRTRSSFEVTLSQLPSGTSVRTFDSRGEQWLDATHFLLSQRQSEQVWVLENGRPRLQRTSQNPLIFSPDRTKTIEISRETHNLSRVPLAPSSFELNHFSIVNAATGQRLGGLPGDGWSAFAWQKQGAELWGVVNLNVFPPRTDILRYDLKSRKTTSLRLDTSDPSVAGGGLAFQFSPDGRFLAAGMQPNSFFLWNTTSGQLVKKILGSEARRGYYTYGDVAFSPDSRVLLRPTREGVEFYQLGSSKF